MGWEHILYVDNDCLICNGNEILKMLQDNNYFQITRKRKNICRIGMKLQTNVNDDSNKIKSNVQNARLSPP